MPDLSPGYAAADIAFVTPTWRGDLERFQLLRESMAAMGLGAVPHYAVVQTEDLALFRQGAAGPIYLSTAEVLPAEVEQLRRRYLDRTPNRRLQVLKRSAYKRFGWFADANYYGWHTQQLVKFAVARQFPQRVLITLDSDVIFTQPVPASAYAADGRGNVGNDSASLASSLESPSLNFAGIGFGTPMAPEDRANLLVFVKSLEATSKDKAIASIAPHLEKHKKVIKRLALVGDPRLAACIKAYERTKDIDDLLESIEMIAAGMDFNVTPMY